LYIIDTPENVSPMIMLYIFFPILLINNWKYVLKELPRIKISDEEIEITKFRKDLCKNIN